MTWRTEPRPALGDDALTPAVAAPPTPAGVAGSAGFPWRQIIRGAAAGAVACAVLALAYWAIAPRTYLARATVAPSSRGTMPRLGSSGLSALAGQLGVMPDAEATTSPQFYGLLAKSEAIQRSMLFATLPPRAPGQPGRPVWAALGLEQCDSICLLKRGLPKLGTAVSVEVDRQTGTFVISSILRDPTEAAGLSNLYVHALDDFNRRVRRTQSRASREFLESRLEIARGELRAAEAQLRAFHEANAGFRTAPRLQLNESRLQRDIASRTEIQAGIARQLETARLDEVSSLPLLTVIDSASAPLRKHSPRGLPLLAVSIIAGSAIGAAVAVALLLRRG